MDMDNSVEIAGVGEWREVEERIGGIHGDRQRLDFGW